MSGSGAVPLFCSLEQCGPMFDKEAAINRVKELIQPLLASRQAELVELTCRQEGSRVIVRLLVDTARGIRLNELSSLNQAIGAILDEHEVISSAYMLEVSSPGLDRPLKTGVDFERVIGRRVRVSTTIPVNSRREHVGELLSAGEEAIVLRLDGSEKIRILLSEIAYAVQEIKI